MRTIEQLQRDDVGSPGPILTVVSGSDEQESRRVQGRYEAWVKPVLDVVLAAAALFLALPAMLGIALAIRVTMGPGVIYRQQRVGRFGRPFTVYKFRTMQPDRRLPTAAQGGQHPWQGEERRVCHKREDDPRHTRLGRFLRRLSLDELPQLVNVLRREMSLVGPRPELVSVVARYQPWQHARHQVKPGITGLWQISARGHGLMCENLVPDIEYVDKVSLKTDLGILLRTGPAALLRRSGD